MKPMRESILLLLAIVLAACGKSEPLPDPLKAQRSAIQKAKGVDDIVGKAAAENRAKIEEAETK
jgi:hypothetical protein